MAEHLFLTGQPQVGKTTLLRRFLAEQNLRIGGFRTVWGDDTHTALYLLPFEGGECCAENRIAERVCGTLVPHADVFDRLGPALLREPCELLAMDELGFLENDAAAFQAAVLAALDGNVPIFGVIKPRHTAFLDAVRACERVRVIEVTAGNRDTLCLR